ncbi:MAG: Holliday junction resolvase RuvX [Gammaproteobacteria bacterium]|nr:MAG: Holliday junction resolvase RuvX [Gammaproteobacteria bacterium]
MGSSKCIVAFDYGEKRIGVAIGQSITETANPLKALNANSGQPNWQEVEKILKEWQPDFLVVGLPLNMDGTEQLLTKRATKFSNRLEGRFGIKVKMMDERLTSVEAREQLFSSSGYKGLQKNSIDSQAACLILESWFHENPNH